MRDVNFLLHLGHETNSIVLIFLGSSSGSTSTTGSTTSTTGSKFEIYNLINKLLESGIAVIIISSELPELLGMCDRIGVMYQGKLQGFLSHAEATQEKVMTLATGGKI